ncbi:MAG: enoyl-CoA hydratase [Burkholderiaceae bacterium]|nr:enoyl-CoA hydratase [Burkholderiaceae bacterium]
MDNSYNCLTVECSGRGWATVAFNRPHKLNTLSIELRQELDAAIRLLEADENVHVLILTGTGKAFTAGLDLDDWSASADPAAAAYRWDAVASLKQFSGPIIAAINGLAITGGIEIALACDLIIASDQAQFADTHVRVGLLPGWGGSARMIERLGLHRAKELALTGRFFSAEEAERWGFVNEVVEHAQLMPRAEALAVEMLQAQPQHLVLYKQLLDNEAQLTFGDAVKFERERSMAVNSLVTQGEIHDRLQKLLQRT